MTEQAVACRLFQEIQDQLEDRKVILAFLVYLLTQVEMADKNTLGHLIPMTPEQLELVQANESGAQ